MEVRTIVPISECPEKDLKYSRRPLKYNPACLQREQYMT